jgi:hypothetical protein
MAPCILGSRRLVMAAQRMDPSQQEWSANSLGEPPPTHDRRD